MLRFASALIAFAAVSTFLVEAQDKPPLPYYSEEAVAHGGFNVFLDRKTGDGIIIWDQPNFDGKQLRIPVELARHIQPSVTTRVAFQPQARAFRYDFVLRNGMWARQTLRSLRFVGLRNRDRYQVTAPPGWTVTFPTNRHVQTEEADSDGELQPIYKALVLSLLDRDPSGIIGVPPGKERGGFQIVTADLPGLIDVYVQGRRSVLALPTEPSEKIRSELLRITDFPYNYVHIVAVAPKYDAHITDSELAAAYARDLQTLRAFEGEAATIAFFEKAREMLAVSDAITLHALATTPLEKDLAAGVASAYSSRKSLNTTDKENGTR